MRTPARSGASIATGTPTGAPTGVTPDRTNANGHPTVTAKAPSVLSRSPTTSSRDGGTPSNFVATAAAIGAYGLPAITGSRPAAVLTAARIAPPPGIGPSGVGYVASSLVATSRAPRAAAVVTVEIDANMQQIAAETLADFNNVVMLRQDALKNKNRFNPQVLAAVKDDLALVAAAVGPYHQFGPDFGFGKPSGANLQIALDMGKYVNSFSWRGDPPR